MRAVKHNYVLESRHICKKMVNSVLKISHMKVVDIDELAELIDVADCANLASLRT